MTYYKQLLVHYSVSLVASTRPSIMGDLIDNMIDTYY
jgi:hypothetical protein